MAMSFRLGSIIEQHDDLVVGQLMPHHLPLSIGSSSASDVPLIPAKGFDST